MNAIHRNSLKQISLYTFVTQFISAAQPWQPCCWHSYKFTIMLAGWDSNPRWSCLTGLTARTVRPLRQPANIIYPIKEYTWLFIQCVSQRGTMHTVLPILETRSIIIIIYFTHQYVKDHTCKYTIAFNILTHISRDVAREGFEPPTFRLWAWRATTATTALC